MKLPSEIRGQSLVEVIIALAILSTAVAGALTLTVSSQNAQKSSEDWLLATNLAREGVEVARNMRDSNWLGGREWDSGLVGPDYDYTAIASFDPEDGIWAMDFEPNAVDEDGTEVWRLTGTHFGVMTQEVIPPAESVASRFRRLISLNAVCRDGAVMTSGSSCDAVNPKVGIRISSEVTWNSGGRSHDTEITETVYDWR